MSSLQGSSLLFECSPHMCRASVIALHCHLQRRGLHLFPTDPVALITQTSSRAVGEVALPRAADGPGKYCMLLCRCAAIHQCGLEAICA